MPYTDAFRRRMIARMTGPRPLSATALAKEVGVPQPTLSKWLREAGTVASMSTPDPKRPVRHAPDLTVQDRVRILAEAADASPEELGALLRRHGLTTADLDAWKDALEGVGRTPKKVGHGSEFTSKALDHWAYGAGAKLDFSRPGKPTDNGIIEAFNSRLRDECLNANWFLSLPDARQKLAEWRRQYNAERPHSALGNLVPAEYAALNRRKVEAETG